MRKKYQFHSFGLRIIAFVVLSCGICLFPALGYAQALVSHGIRLDMPPKIFPNSQGNFKINISGTYASWPGDDRAWLLVATEARTAHWVQGKLKKDDNKRWHAEATIQKSQERKIYWVVVVSTGSCGRSLCEYYLKVADLAKRYIPFPKTDDMFVEMELCYELEGDRLRDITKR